MDINFIVDFSPSGGGRVYQGGAPDDGIATFQTAGRITMLVEMAAGVDALRWVRQGTLKSVLYFGIDDTPEGCLEDGVLIALARSCRSWLATGLDHDVIFGCAAGVSRSSYANCATLMATMHVGFDEALSTIRNGRPVANPNQGFVDQLRRMELQLRAL